jgi:hypothetical protein
MENTELSELIKILKHFVDLLEPFKTLLNTHNVQFLLESHWQNDLILTEKLRLELECLINESSANCINLVKSYKEFLLSANGSSNGSFKIPLYSQLKECNDLWNEKIVVDGDQFLNKLISSSKDSVDLMEFNRSLKDKFAIIGKQNRFMNEKKSYEVDTMSKFVANLCKKFNIDTVSNLRIFLFLNLRIFKIFKFIGHHDF